MMYSLTIGIGSIVALMVGWALVQSTWKRLFHEDLADEDALAGRSSCGGCGCGVVCKKKRD
jgi:hypothetical protein